jgi:hypothetical protein
MRALHCIPRTSLALHRGLRHCSVLVPYPEEAQLLSIKPKEFYELHAAKREYFYFIDLQGRLFLEDMVPKSIATSLKSPKFLRFFFSQVRANDTNRCVAAKHELLSEVGCSLKSWFQEAFQIGSALWRSPLCHEANQVPSL